MMSAIKEFWIKKTKWERKGESKAELGKAKDECKMEWKNFEWKITDSDREMEKKIF